MLLLYGLRERDHGIIISQEEESFSFSFLQFCARWGAFGLEEPVPSPLAANDPEAASPKSASGLPLPSPVKRVSRLADTKRPGDCAKQLHR
jgi:hypothetical protein